ncbi:MAG TPA: SDR family NAD(P)-dependent oxidoreductase [Terracidiphilus sp.]|nr:SDR family NAD(P)-dependent oxidoreductase [Terracidiphilus sp.]
MSKGHFLNIKGKVAVVTGGGAGLGAAFCRALAANGARVVVADIRGDKAAETAAAVGGEAVTLDVTNPAQIEELLFATRAKFGSLDIIINNAGVSAGGETTDIQWSDWERVIKVNLMGVIAGSLAALKIMKVQGSGQILNMGSLNGLALTPMLGPYSASKAGVVFFSRGLAEEAKAWGVHVAVGCPGNVHTAILPAHVTRLMRPMDPDYAAIRLLEGLQKGKRIIIFPLYARLWWWLDRVSPGLLAPLRQIVVKRARARQAVLTSSQAAQ